MAAPECIDTPDLLLEWSEAAWDTAVFGFPVLQIGCMELRTPRGVADFPRFEAVRDETGAGMVSCRLSHRRLRESMLLEDRGFRFVEMVFHPELEELPGRLAAGKTLEVERARAKELPAIQDVAGSVFCNERFHMDPRLDPAIGDQRYRNWVLGSFDHPTQRLYALRDEERLVAFFVTEMLADGTCYWHLNGVAPEDQGKGYGRRAWLSMLCHAKENGAVRVRTCITARNHRVLNLYVRLGFRFPPPLMTFHWVRAPWR